MSRPARTADASALFATPAAATNSSNAQAQQRAASGPGGADKAQQAGAAWAAAVSQIAARIDVDSECECSWNDANAAATAAATAAKAAESTNATAAAASPPSAACQRVVSEVLSLLDSLRNGPSLPSHASYTAILELSRRSPALFRLPPLQHAVMQMLALSASSAANGPQLPAVSFHAPYHSATANAAASAGAAQLRRKSPLLPVLASALLDSAFRCLPVGRSWPTALAFALINDALEARSWCDAECCTHLVETITLALRDTPPAPATAIAAAPDSKPAAVAASSNTGLEDSDEEEEIVEEESGSVNPSPSPSPPPTSSIVIPFTAAALAAFPAISIAAGMAALARTPVNTAAAAAALAPSARPASTVRTTPLIPRYTSLTALEEIRRHAEVMFVRACREACGLPAEVNTSGMKHYNAPAMAAPKPATSIGPLLRFLGMTLGYRSMRHFATLNIEAWLNSQNSNRPAKRLLLQLTSEISARFSEEVCSADPAAQSRLARLHPLSGLGALKPSWNELSQHISNFNAEVLHTWSRTGGVAAPPASAGMATVTATGASAPPLLDLHNARMLVSMASRVRSGPGVAQQTAWDDAYLDSLARLLGAAAGSSEIHAAKIHSDASHYAAPAAPSPNHAQPMLWKVAFFTWLTLDWNHAASMQGMSNAAMNNPSPAPPSAGPLAPSALLQSPSHFVLRMLDVLLRCQPDGGLALHLAQVAFSCLDRPDLMVRIQFVLRRVALLNTTALAVSSNSTAAAATVPVVRSNPVATFMDFFAFISILLDAPSYPQHPHHVFSQLQEPVLSAEPFGAASSAPPSATSVKSYTESLSKFQLRRECAVTELVNLVVWSCIQAAQPLLWLQVQVMQTGYERTAVIMTHTNQAIAAAAAGGQSALSQTAPAGFPSLSSSSSSAPSSSPLTSTASHRNSPRRPLNFDRSLRTFRFAIADVHAKAMLWCQTWLCAVLNNKPAPAGLPVSEPAHHQSPAVKDVNQLFSELLSNLLFLQPTPQQFLAPFVPTSGPSAAALATSGPKPIAKETTAVAPTSFLSDLWPLDVSLLRKSSTLLLDKLPLLEDSIARLVLTALAHPDKLPRAQAIQILEILLRRVCLLSLSVGKQYEQAASSGKIVHTGTELSDADEDETAEGSNLGLVRVQNDQLLEGILQLSQFPTPVPPPIPAGASHPPLLALSALFWRSCVLLVILSAFNPHTIGRKSWEAVPTLRCLLEMALSEIWIAPTAAAQAAAAAAADKSLASSSSAPPTSFTLSSLFPPFPDLITKSLLLHKQGVEIEAILFIENQLPDNNRSATASGQAPVPKVLRTRENSLYLSCNYLMLLEPSEILRRPPEHILQTLQKLCDDFQLGTLLRQSAAPNFLANMLQRQTPAQYVVWLRSLVISEPGTLEMLPTFAITELLLAVADRIQFEPVPSVMPGATEQSVEEAFDADADAASARRKNRGQHHHSSSAAATASSAARSASSDPILEHLPMLLSILRRTLPNLSHIYAMNAKTTAAPTASIMAVLSPSLSAASTAAAATAEASAAASSASAFFPSVRAQAESASSSSSPPFNQTAFLDLLGLFLSRLTSRSASVRRLATHALHFLLCPQNLPNTFAGASIPCVCGSGVEANLNSSGSIPPLPPATCWLRFFFTWFLHSSDATVSTAPSLSPSFVAAGRVIIHRVVSALMSALEIENDPDVLLGYMAFLHSIATRFSPDPPPLGSPSKLFCLDLALRVCDVVLAREIVTDKLMAPVRMMQKPPPAASSPSSTPAAAAPAAAPSGQSKRRKLSASLTTVPALDDLPDLDLEQTTTRGEAEQPSAEIALEPASAAEDSGKLPFSGYAVMLSILSAAYDVVEFMQDDEALIRRMLARGRATATAAAKSSRGSKELSKPGMRRGSSNEMEDEVEEEEEIVESSSGGAPATPQRGDAMEDATVPPPLNRSLSVSDAPASTSVGDEEFVTLHRSWPTCTKPIMAYVPLPLLHGILDFLSFPYALPAPTSLQSSPALLAPFASYQHLLGVLVPEAPPEQLGHVVTIPELESALPTLGIAAGASWLLDSAQIRWPLPSDLHASKLLAHSSTPILLLLAIEVCPPNQLLSVMMQFGLQPPIVRRMLAKLDSWAGYQLRLTQRQSGSAASSSTAAPTSGGLKASGSFPSGLSLSPGMRELLQNLDKLMHFVSLYRSLLQRENKAAAAATMDTSSNNDVPGQVLVSYLQSLAPQSNSSSALPVQSSTPAKTADDSATIEKQLLSSLRHLLSCKPHNPLPMLSFRRLCECAEQSPSVILRLLDSAFDPEHAHLHDAWPLLCMVISDASYVKDPSSVAASVSTLRALLPRMADAYAALSSESSAHSESAQLGSQSRVLFEEWRFACDTWIGVQTIDLSADSGSA